jgi:transposase
MAHKIGRMVYHLLTNKHPYHEECAEEADQKRQERELKQLARRAQKLGYSLNPLAASLPASSP